MKNATPFKVGILGASGFVGRELTALLAADPNFEIIFLQSESQAGKKPATMKPVVSGAEPESSLVFENISFPQMIERKPACVLFATPHGVALNLAQQFLDAGIRVLDLSADFRFMDHKIFEETYELPYTYKGPAPVYGLTEFCDGTLRDAQLVSNPGCYVTSALLVALPIKHMLEWAIFDGKSGYSGAGIKNAQKLSTETMGIAPYNVAHHRHGPEIQQFLDVPSHFTPHVLPVFRGIEMTSHVQLKREFRATDFHAFFQKQYDARPYVSVQQEIPRMQDVIDTNRAILGGFSVDRHGRLVVISMIDNLRKGAASQAMQNLHAMFGLPPEIPDIAPTSLFTPNAH